VACRESGSAPAASTKRPHCRRGTWSYGQFGRVIGIGVGECIQIGVIRLGHEARKRARTARHPTTSPCGGWPVNSSTSNPSAAKPLMAFHPSRQAQRLEQATALLRGFLRIRPAGCGIGDPTGAACTEHAQPPAGSGSTTMVRIVMAVLRAPAAQIDAP